MADVTSTFAAKDVGFTSTVNRMQKSLQGIEGSMSGFVTKAAGLATAVVGIGAAFLGIRAAVQSFNAAIEMGGKLNDLSARTGETAGNLAILQRAFENAGAGADAVGPTINRLQRAIIEAGEGGKQQAEAFAKLGVNLADIRNLTPTEQLQAVATALQGVGNDSDRSAIAMQLLGRSGGELLPLLRAMGSELDVARNQLGSLPGVMDRTNKALDTIGDNFNAIGQKGTEFAAGLLQNIAPALADLTTRMANIDAAGFGAKLSEYVEATARWIAETFKLNDALNNIETAIKGITSGNFGSGLGLMFLTARDTALNAINQIVAAASAAIESVSGAIGQMFRGEGPLVLLMKTSFSIASNFLKEALYGALADFMDAIGRSGMADTFRYQAETAAKSIETLTYGIGAQIEEVGHDAKETFGGIPAAFKASYAANMENPLIDMRDRTKETADQAERVEQATRAAAFNAEKFGKAMRDAQERRLSGGGFSPFGGPPETGETGMGVNSNNRLFPWQGSGPSGSQQPMVAEAKAPSGSGASSGSAKELTKLEALQNLAKTDPRARAALFRLQAEQEDMANRASALRGMGRFGSAAREEVRGERRAERSASREMQAQMSESLFGSRNLGDAVRNFERDARLAGMTNAEALSRMGVDRKLGESTRDAMQRMLAEQSMTEAQRKERDQRGAGSKDQQAAVALATEGTLQSLLTAIVERLPQNALDT